VRVAIISDLKAPTGATIQGNQIAEWFQKKGLDVTLVNSAIEKRNLDDIQFESKGIPTVIPTKSLANSIKAVDPDVVLTTTYSVDLIKELHTVQGICPVIYRACVCPIELHIMSGYSSQIPHVVKFLKRFDGLIVPSQTQADIMASFGCEESRIHKIRTAVDVERIKPSYCKDPTVLHFGRVLPKNNGLTVLQAVKMARFEIPELELGIAGTGNLNAFYYQFMQKQFMFGGVKFLGFYEDMNKVFQECSVAVLPSITGALDNCVIESFAAGLPCIMSDIGPNKEFQSEELIKVRHDDPVAIAKEIVKLLTDENYYKKVRRAQFAELKNFDYGKMIDEYIEVLKAYADTHSPA